MTEQKTTPRLRQNVTKKEWRFLLHFTDDRTEEISVMASTFPAAVLSLPRFADVGKYKYTLLKGKVG